jgi:threonylcarbamoyladenosine tRNA methylthiotransferase MtaB
LQLPGVSQVVGNSHKHRLAEIVLPKAFIPLSSLSPSQRLIHVSDIFAHTELLAAPVFDAANERTRPNLKVQDGCDNRCSFCVITSVRGQGRSLRLHQDLEEVKALVDAGSRDVVISESTRPLGRDLRPKPPKFEA